MSNNAVKTDTPEFLQYFNKHKEANKLNWDVVACILAVIHWTAVKNGYVHIKPEGIATEILENVSKKIIKKNRSHRHISLVYDQKNSGLKKLFQFVLKIICSTEYIQFGWKSSNNEQNYMSPCLNLRFYIKNHNGNSLENVFHCENLWQLVFMASICLIPQGQMKEAYVRKALESANSINEIEFLQPILFKYIPDNKANTDLDYLEKCWGPKNPLMRFVGFHLHELFVNNSSQLKLCTHCGWTAAKSYEERDGSWVLEACYKSMQIVEIMKLIITEKVRENELGISIKFGAHDQIPQVMELYGAEYVRLVDLESDNLWKFSGKVRVKLFWERDIDKFNELLSTYLGAETLEKKNFVKAMLIEFTGNLPKPVYMQFPYLTWHAAVLELDGNFKFKELTFFNILLAEYITRDGGVREHDQLRKAWGVEKPGAFHLVAFFLHLALIAHPSKPNLLRKIGENGVEAVVASSREEVGGNRVLEAEYKFEQGGTTKKLSVHEGVQDRLIWVNFEDIWIPLHVHDHVDGYEWNRGTNNSWKWLELVDKLKDLFKDLDS